MSKVTFRADEDLIRAVEALDASKSEVMREALRAYLEDDRSASGSPGNARISERVDAVLADRLRGGARDVNVTISVEPPAGTEASTRIEREATPGGDRTGGESSPGAGAPSRSPSGAERGTGGTCNQCGEMLSDGHVYCPNCGEKAANRLFCECGDEIRSDWGYCPSCGRRTPSADVLDG